MKVSTKTVFAVLVGVVLLGGGIALTTRGCLDVGDTRPVMGNHGYRVYANEVIQSFEHGGRSVCVRDGWKAVGALTEENGEATFPPGKTGVLIKQEFFAGRTIRPQGSSYEVTVLYPLSIEKGDAAKYIDTVSTAFSRVAALYDDVPKADRTPHTVLVTAEIIGPDDSEESRIYPDPTGRVTYFVRTPDHERAIGLLIHAVAHLYNREHVATNYTALQDPFSKDEFEELEATWAEVALSPWPDAGFSRLMYLYKVHSAVVTQNSSLVTEPPFNDTENFKKILPTVFVRESSNYLDYQYGHYVLLPLVTAAVDALLYEEGTGLRVERLLRDIHAGKRKNFMEELKLLLPEKKYREVERWLNGDAQVPFPLIETAISKVYTRP